MDIALVDYGMGNLRSIQKKLLKLGANVIITSDPLQIKKSDKIILPGVGHFKKAVSNLLRLSLWEVLNEEVLVKSKPILGICLGMQLMAGHSEEGDARGFGWLDADVKRFEIRDKLHYKIPHIGWNQIKIYKNSKIFSGVQDNSYFYFVHSYYMECKNLNDVLAVSEYEQEFVSAVEKRNIIGFQFHPEKSHDLGELLLKNFLKLY